MQSWSVAQKKHHEKAIFDIIFLCCFEFAFFFILRVFKSMILHNIATLE